MLPCSSRKFAERFTHLLRCNVASAHSILGCQFRVVNSVQIDDRSSSGCAFMSERIWEILSTAAWTHRADSSRFFCQCLLIETAGSSLNRFMPSKHQGPSLNQFRCSNHKRLSFGCSKKAARTAPTAPSSQHLGLRFYDSDGRAMCFGSIPRKKKKSGNHDFPHVSSSKC
jgi:hypothetical protein